MDMQKINHGIILDDFPEIWIDKFPTSNLEQSVNNHAAFFITYYDDEILIELLNGQFFMNLDNKSNSYCLYMHKIVYLLLKYYFTTSFYGNPEIDGEAMNMKLEQLVEVGKIILIEVDSPIQLHFNNNNDNNGGERSIKLTPISSGSNAGCIMLLLETNEKCLLYTGSCRLTLKDLKNCAAFHNSDGTVKKIDKIYLDTTFCLFDVKELPSRSVVIKQLSKQLMKQIELNQTNLQFEFTTLTELKISNLFCLRKIAELTQQQIHVPFELDEFLKNFNDFQSCIDYEANSQTLIHYDCGDSCDNEECSPCKKYDFQEYYDISSISIDCKFLPFFGTGPIFINPKTIHQIEWVEKGNCVYTSTVNEVISYNGIYSNHLSLNEMGRMLNYLNVKPVNVLPLFLRQELFTDDIELALEFACSDAASEPLEIAQELSSQHFDFTQNEFNKVNEQ